MKRLVKHLAEIDQVETPEEWEAIQQKVPRFASVSVEPRLPGVARRTGIIALAFATFLAAGAFAFRAFESQGAVSSAADSETTGASTSTSPSTITQAGLPSEASVKDGRFIEPVALDGGLFRVDVAPADVVPTISEAEAETAIWADPEVKGIKSGYVLGFGLVSSSLSSPDGRPVDGIPAWVGFAWGGFTNCPAHLGSFDANQLPSNGYLAVVVGTPSDGAAPFTYSAETSTCFEPPTAPTVMAATEVVSVAWSATGDIANGRLPVEYTMPPCARDFAVDVGGGSGITTIAVEVVVPLAPAPCPSPTKETAMVDLSPEGSAVLDSTTIQHAALGPVRQIQQVAT